MMNVNDLLAVVPGTVQLYIEGFINYVNDSTRNVTYMYSQTFDGIVPTPVECLCWWKRGDVAFRHKYDSITPRRQPILGRILAATWQAKRNVYLLAIAEIPSGPGTSSANHGVAEIDLATGDTKVYEVSGNFDHFNILSLICNTRGELLACVSSSPGIVSVWLLDWNTKVWKRLFNIPDSFYFYGMMALDDDVIAIVHCQNSVQPIEVTLLNADTHQYMCTVILGASSRVLRRRIPKGCVLFRDPLEGPRSLSIAYDSRDHEKYDYVSEADVSLRIERLL
jgi:hypothetical protein